MTMVSHHRLKQPNEKDPNTTNDHVELAEAILEIHGESERLLTLGGCAQHTSARSLRATPSASSSGTWMDYTIAPAVDDELHLERVIVFLTCRLSPKMAASASCVRLGKQHVQVACDQLNRATRC
jgi:hypothetical protein